MNIIVTVDENWGISCNDRPFASIPAEKKSKMQEITGHVVVYDMKALVDLPGQQPVQGCTNLIFTDGYERTVRGAKTVPTIEALREELSKYDSDDIYIISSEKLYREFLPDTDTVHVTKIDYSYKADAFFENLDENPDFYIAADSDEQYCFDIIYSFLRYERRDAK